MLLKLILLNISIVFERNEIVQIVTTSSTTRRLQNISDGNFLTIVFCPKRMHPKNYSISLKIFQLKIDSQQKAQIKCTDSKSNTIWSNKPLFNWLIPQYDRLYNWIIFNDHHF